MQSFCNYEALTTAELTLYNLIDKLKIREKSDNLAFSYKEQYAVVVICKDENEQKAIYDRLFDEGYKLKVVAV